MPDANCAAVVLAAGASTRMAPYHKLLVKGSNGRTMIERTVANVLSSRARPIIVVTGARDADIRAALGACPVTFAHAADHAEGIAASLRQGIGVVPSSARAAFVILGDMPLVPGRVVDSLIAAFSPTEGRSIVVPVFQGRAGNPILWGARFFPEMLTLTGDQGARRLLSRHAACVAEVDVTDDGVLRDFDTLESLTELPVEQSPLR